MGGERHPDGARTLQATAADLATYENAQRQLAEFSAPVLLDRESGDDRLFVAAFDGTANSMYRDSPENHTNVARIFEQIETRHRGGETEIGAGYVEGVGTQGGLAGSWDAARGHTYRARLEDMYLQFASQAQGWLRENPGADIRLASIGFSRGAEQAAGFTRMVEERGIQDPEGAIVTRGRDGLIEAVEYTRPALRAPGTVVQAVGMFDPVGTGEPRSHDRRLAGSVVSSFQITALDEQRNLFQGTRVTDPGMTADGRSLNVGVAGAHSNIGGGYELDGLSTRSGNLMADYLNALASEPFLAKREVQPDPARDVIHRSQDHLFFYRTSVYERLGERAHVELLAPPPLCRIDCRDAEPRNEAMAAGLQWQRVRIGPVPEERAPAVSAAQALAVDRLLAVARQGDGEAIRRMSFDFLDGPVGRAWRAAGDARLHELEAAGREAEARSPAALELSR